MAATGSRLALGQRADSLGHGGGRPITEKATQPDSLGWVDFRTREILLSSAPRLPFIRDQFLKQQ